MRKLHFLAILTGCLFFSQIALFAQDARPDLMYFRFDEAGQSVTPNKANPATRVSTQASISGSLSMGQTGQFGSALVGVGGGVTNIVPTGWTTSFGTSSWTISFWINNVNGSTFGYYFGDPSAASFRCFNAGAAGTNNLVLRGGFSDVRVDGVAPGPTVVHFVCDRSANQIRAYKNGVLHRTVSITSTLSINGSGGQFGVGAYSGGGGSGSFPAGALMDEFRMYNRALTDQEIADTWNDEVDCFIPANSIGWALVDASGLSAPYANTPGTTYIKYNVDYPDGATPVTITVDFYTVPGDVLAYSAVINDSKIDGQPLEAIQAINIPPSVPAGIYRAQTTFNTTNSCGVLFDYDAGSQALFLLEPGTSICVVWPGDVNNDGLCNYGDMKSLTNYIHEANLRSDWLAGPARYRANASEDPLSYLRWEAQPAVPWATDNGCYMDVDGNGTINNFDFVGIKMNWMRAHDASTGKNGISAMPNSFSMSQNFPNPFNPTTNIEYNLPERSYVTITVNDVLGRTIATLVDGEVNEGSHTVQFNGVELQSGTYIATATMRGMDSDVSFTKTIRMTLTK